MRNKKMCVCLFLFCFVLLALFMFVSCSLCLLFSWHSCGKEGGGGNVHTERDDTSEVFMFMFVHDVLEFFVV